VKRKTLWTFLLGSISALLPRCSCDEGQDIRRAAVEMKLTFVEEDSCSGAQVPRRIPDDYESNNRPLSTDFGSRGERIFEVRSTGSAPLTVERVQLSAEDPEYTIEAFSELGGVSGDVAASFPVTINANQDPGAAPGLIIRVRYQSQDAEADLVELVIVSDDPNRSEVRFGMSAGLGRIEVCGNAGCDATAGVDFGNVSLGETGTEQVTIRNVGQGDLDLLSLRLESISGEFCANELTELPPGVSGCPLVQQCMVLRPGETYTVNLDYAPIDGGLDTGVIHITSGDAMTGNVDVPINGRGAGPAICPCVVDGASCTPVNVIDFGLADVGAASSRTVRLESCGTEAVDLAEATLETDPANAFFTGPEFQIATAFPTGSYPPGQYSEGVIEFRPTSGGTSRGGLRFTVAQTQLKSWILLQGSAATCDLEPIPTAVSFGTVAGGSQSDRNVILANNGTKDCLVTAIGDPADATFTITNKPALPYLIPAGSDYTLTVHFAPPVGPVSTYMSSFDVTSDEPGAGANNTITLTAQGGGTPICEVVVTPSGNDSPITMNDGRLEFGAVNIGYMKTLTLRVDNVGNTDCVLQSYTLVTESPAEFNVLPAQPVPAQILPGQSASLDVRFAPTGPASNVFGLYGGFLNHLDFTLQGQGLAKPNWVISISARPTEPTIDVIPQSVDFGVVTWERPQPPDNRSSCGSVVRSVNVYNSGTGALTLTSVGIDPTSDPVFLVTEVLASGTNPINPPYQNITVQPGAHVEVRLRFFPSRSSPASHQGLLVIDNDVTNAGGQGAPLTVPLSGESTINSSQTDIFAQLTDNKVDILWVVDDSGSMSEEQNLLAQNFSSFIGFADTLGVDYQVGVITTEVNDSPAGKLWACNGYNKIITDNDANRIAAFQCAANVTNPPGGNSRPNPGGSDEAEAGLEAARKALDVPVVNAENAGFLRSDARLAVIIVSDEEDQSQGPVTLYVDFFRNVKGFANPQLVSVSAIAGDVPGGCATAEAGTRYHQAVSQLNGQYESICTSSWQTMLMNIGLDVFTLRTAWQLSRPADPSTITVRVNGVPVAMNGTNGWTFDSASNTLTFHGTEVPDPGATIEVQYGTLCIP
jgi:hypothetical protein